jgi:hypothetical protein
MQLSKLGFHLTHPRRSAGLVRDMLQARRRARDLMTRQSRLVAEGERELRRMSPPRDPKGVIPIMHCGFYHESAAFVPVAMEAMRRGWQPIWVHNDVALPFPPGSPFARFNGWLERHSRQLYVLSGRSNAGLLNDWTVDFPNEIAICDGENYFPAIAGKLRRIFKCFDLDWENPTVAHSAAETLRSADATYRYCTELFETACAQQVPVRFIGAEHLYVPAGIPMMYSKLLRARGAPQCELFEFIDLGGSYTHFFTDGEYNTPREYAVQNITRRETYSRHEVLRGEFEQWIKDRAPGESEISFGRSVMHQKWTGSSEIDPRARAALERISAHRDAGGKAVWMFGHAVVELGNPSDFGAIHPSLKAWIHNTIDIINGTNSLLVVKPHPAEARYKPNRRPNQLFSDLFPKDLPENVVFLDALWAPLDQVLPLIDVGTVWRGSAGAQLMMEAIPGIVCGMHTAYQDVLAPPQPTSRDHYRTMLLDPSQVPVGPERQRRAALYFAYMRDQTMFPVDVMEPGEMVTVDGFSYLRFSLKWDHGKLREMRVNGDENIARICDVICA